MQLMIDTETEAPANMRLIADFLIALTVGVENSNTDSPPIGTTTGESVVIPFPPPPPPAPAGVAVTAADVFASANLRTDLSALPNSPPNSGIPLPPPPAAQIPSPPAATPNPLANSGSPLEFDSSGMPWDARIHQKKKTKKKDGTWKLQKGIDQNIVTAVVSELVARNATVRASVGAALPSESNTQTSMTAELQFDPRKVFGDNPPVELPPGASAVPLPPGSSVAGNPALVAQPATGIISFRDLVKKIIAGTKSGKFTTDQVTAIVQGSGAPSLQVLSTMANLIPHVNAQIDALLAA